MKVALAMNGSADPYNYLVHALFVPTETQSLCCHLPQAQCLVRGDVTHMPPGHHVQRHHALGQPTGPLRCDSDLSLWGVNCLVFTCT